MIKYQLRDCLNGEIRFVLPVGDGDVDPEVPVGSCHYIEFSGSSEVVGYSGCVTVMEFTDGEGPELPISGMTSINEYFSCNECISDLSISCPSVYCVDIGLPGSSMFDGQYVLTGQHNGMNYYSGATTGTTGVVYFDTEKWCLSTELDGNCIFYGAQPCNSACPDLCNGHFDEGFCLTTTATTECEVDFEVHFDCQPEAGPCEICCECEPQDCEWYRYNNTSCACEQSVPSTVPESGTTYTAISRTYEEYSWYGTNIYDGNGDLGVSLTGTTAWQNTGSTNTNDLTSGPLNRCGIWSDLTSGGDYLPLDTWIGFSFCVEVTEENKVLYVGLGADNGFSLRVNGTVELEETDVDQNNFRIWHVHPVEMNMGTNIIELFGINNGSVGVIGCEIYDNTLEELQAAEEYIDLNIIYSTREEYSGEFDLVADTDFNYLTSGYTCPSGYTYNPCNGQCTQFIICEDEIIPVPPDPEPIEDLCSGTSMNVTITTYTDTGTTTTTTTTTMNYVSLSGETSFTLLDGLFMCQHISKKLVDCSDGSIYYTNETLMFDGSEVQVGETFNAIVSGGIYACLTLVGTVDDTSPNISIDEIISVFCGCENCIPPPTTITTTTTTICCPDDNG